jgi:hypothetical protein
VIEIPLLVASLIVVPWLIFALASLFAGFPRLRLHQILGIVGVSAWVFAFLAGGPSGGTDLLIYGSMFLSLMLFAAMWTREFRLLMLRRADEFPDWYDKLAWVFVLTVMAPVGVWLFRSYRHVHWPEPAKETRLHPLDEPEPGVDASEMQRIGA